MQVSAWDPADPCWSVSDSRRGRRGRRRRRLLLLLLLAAAAAAARCQRRRRRGGRGRLLAPLAVAALAVAALAADAAVGTTKRPDPTKVPRRRTIVFLPAAAAADAAVLVLVVDRHRLSFSSRCVPFCPKSLVLRRRPAFFTLMSFRPPLVPKRVPFFVFPPALGFPYPQPPNLLIPCPPRGFLVWVAKEKGRVPWKTESSSSHFFPLSGRVSLCGVLFVGAFVGLCVSRQPGKGQERDRNDPTTTTGCRERGAQEKWMDPRLMGNDEAGKQRSTVPGWPKGLKRRDGDNTRYRGKGMLKCESGRTWNTNPRLGENSGGAEWMRNKKKTVA